MATAPRPCQERLSSGAFMLAYPLGVKWLVLVTGVWLIASEANFSSCFLALRLCELPISVLAFSLSACERS